MLNLLESAGFSRANPYYVVQQGKVSGQALHTTAASVKTASLAASEVFKSSALESPFLES